MQLLFRIFSVLIFGFIGVHLCTASTQIAQALEAGNLKLEATLLKEGRAVAIREGDLIPEFALVSQNEQIVKISDFRGQPFVLNFIFTRCGVAEMCPASTQRMVAMEKRASELGLESVQFVTISFDPVFDTPEILSNYAKAFGASEDRHWFLTYHRPEFIDSLLYLFGILTREENGTINHTSATYLVDTEGRIALRQNGPNWSSEKFLARLEAWTEK